MAAREAGSHAALDGEQSAFLRRLRLEMVVGRVDDLREFEVLFVEPEI